MQVFIFQFCQTLNLYLTFRGPCIVIYSYDKAKEMHYFSNLFW